MTTGSGEGALVLFSGGQDSAVCLAWALARFGRVETVGFDYGQRHRAELDVRRAVRHGVAVAMPEGERRLGEDHMVDLGVLGAISETALTRESGIAMRDDGLPTTFVPGRNLIFFSFAAAVAYRRDLRRIVGGMCETDYSGYPDCRDDTIKAMQLALNLGMDRRFVLETPLMWLTKAGTWRLAEELGGRMLVEIVRDRTLSCYLGDTETRHDWGMGCGGCPACDLRRRGYREYRGAADRA